MTRRDHQWLVQAAKRDANQNDKILEFLFDVLFICNGHFSKPKLPEFYEIYEMKWLHSHDYRSAKNYAGQTVAVVGASHTTLIYLKKILADRIQKQNDETIDYGANNNFCEDRLKNFL